MEVDKLFRLLKILVKVSLFLSGVVLLFGGGACAMIGMDNLDRSRDMVVVAVLVALVGVALITFAILWGKKKKQGNE